EAMLDDESASLGPAVSRRPLLRKLAALSRLPVIGPLAPRVVAPVEAALARVSSGIARVRSGVARIASAIATAVKDRPQLRIALPPALIIIAGIGTAAYVLRAPAPPAPPPAEAVAVAPLPPAAPPEAVIPVAPPPPAPAPLETTAPADASAATTLVTLTSTPARAGLADSRADAKRHFREGMSLIAAGQVERGIAELKQAYAIKPHPDVLYDIAKAYVDLGNIPEALNYFRQYVATDPIDKDQVLSV